ncbi:MAG: MFS transporter [Chloroflexi bacterium]|nr:MAG: MFS transporter [Chloroflexota bacterium]
MSSPGRVGRGPAFWIVAATLVLFLFAAAAPSPLYAVYAAKWRFSPAALTEVFAIYAIALLVALLLTGSLSDAVGRRPVILAALGIQVASMLMFLYATDISWLFAARVAQGIATGMATSPLAASFVDLQPPERPNLAAIVNSVTPTLGLALGALASSVLVQYGPDPLHLIYWLMLVGFVLAGIGVALMAEPAQRRARLRLAPRVGVEPTVRPAFAAALPSLIAGWGVGGFYLSLGPSLALQLAGSTNRVLGGLAIGLLAGVGAAAIVTVRSWQPRRAMVVGGIALVAGLALTVVAVALTSALLFFTATAVTGIGFGVGWLGVLRSLVTLAATTARGALIAAIYIVAYLAFALPAVAAGYGVTRVGLHQAALEYGVAICLLAVAGLVAALLVNRPSRVGALR